MQTLKLSENSFSQVVMAAADCLGGGGVIAAPTETVYGLMTGWRNQAGRDGIYSLKRRSEDKPLQMLTLGISDRLTAGEVTADARLIKLVERFCPGALTVVVPGRHGTVGLRIPDSPFMIALLEELGGPIAATSANLSGQPPATTVENAVRDLAGQPDMLIDGGPVPHGRGSTVVSLVGNQAQLLREGPIGFAAIQKVLAE